MTELVAIKAILDHSIAVNQEVRVQGWVRSRRTSKGGFAFIHLHDGSCFDTIQAVADEALANYDEINPVQAVQWLFKGRWWNQMGAAKTGRSRRSR